MISYLQIVIFASSAAVSFCREFCDNGEIINLNCPLRSLVTGIQTTSTLFSKDATTLCSDMASYWMAPDFSVEHFHYKTPDAEAVVLPKLHNSRYSTLPKFFCADNDYGVQNISMCSEDGSITETVITCRGLIDIPHSSGRHTVIGKPDSLELKCGSGSLLNRLEYDRDEEGNLIAIAKCVQAMPPTAVQNCSVVEMTRDSVRVSCYRSSDGIRPSFLMETYSPGSSRPANISSQSPDFLVKRLAPATEYNLKVYAVNFRGRSPPLTVKASTLGNPKRRTGAEGCEDGTLVEIECPDGYIVTGVYTNFKYLFRPDMHPLCSKIADKLILNPTDPSIPTSTSKIYPREVEDKFLQIECSEAAPAVLKFSICLVDNLIWRSVTHCRPFKGNAKVTAYYSIEGGLDTTVLRCPEGSFLNSIKVGSDGRVFTIPTKCSVIEE